MNKTLRTRFYGIVYLQIAMAVLLLGMSTSAAAVDSDGFVYPVLGVSQTDPVTNTSNPLDDGWHGNGVGANVSDFDDGHLGQDYAKAGCAGLPVYAVSKGKVVQVIDADNQYGWADGGDHGWGRVIIIEHTLSSGFKTDNSMVTTTLNEANPRKVYSLYGHLKRGSILVSVGAAVDKGQKIAEIGQDGVDLDTGGSHLHFEIKNGSAYASKECCVSQPTYGVGFGYSGKSDYAPNRYIPSVFIENNKAINRILIKPAGGTTIYWLQHGIIYPVSAPSVIDTMKAAGIANWDWGKVVTVSDISKYTTGPTILTATSASDNLLVKDVSTKRIYIMNNGVKEYQPTLASFADVIDMAPAYFAQEASGTYTAGQSAPTDAIRQVFATTYDANSADLGSPTDVVKATSSATGVTGYYQTFANGSIQYMASGANAGSAFAVYGEIYDKWAQLHYASSPLGLPTGSQSAQFISSQGTTGYYQSFERGSIQVNIKDNIKYAYAVYGKIYEKWGLLSYATGALGLPIGDIVENVRSGFGTTGYYQRFEKGSIQVIGANAYAVSGAIYGEWGKHGYAGKFMPGEEIDIAQATWAGFPVSDAYAWSGKTRQNFEGGYIATIGGGDITAEFFSDKHPQGLTAVLQTGDTIRLTWQNRITTAGVNVYRSGSPTELIAAVEGSATSYTDTTAATGHAYTYFVTALNDTAESPASNLTSMAISGTGQNILTVSKTGLGSGTVTSADGGIFCGSDCSEGYGADATVTLTAQPDSNSAFGGWSGACAGTSATCTCSLNGATSITASFNELAYEPRSPGEEEIIGIVTDFSSGAAISGVAVSTTNNSSTSTGSIHEAFDGQTIDSQWTLGGNANPFISSDKRLRFGAISHNQFSSISRVGNVLESTTVSFDYQASSESGYDYLRFYIDGIEKQKWSGSTSGVYSTNIAAGNHTFLWKYTKDGSASYGSDTAWIDNISIGGIGTPGHYALGPLSPGTYIVTYSKAGYQTIATSATVLAGQATVLDVAMPISLSGTVKDSASNLPLSGVTVSTTGANATTDANGKYTLGSLVPGDYSLTFSKEGYQTITKSMTVLAGQGTTLDAILPVSLSGTVTDMSTGNLITSVTVTATGGTSSQTNTTGYYALGSLSPGVYEITFTKSGYQTVSAPNVVIRAGEATVLNMELTIPGYLTITASTLPPADTGSQYNPRVKISGGVWPYTYSIAYGTLPPGLSLDTVNGNITGTPTSVGSYTLAIRVTDKSGKFAQQEFTIEVTNPLSIVTSSLARATKGSAYQQSIAANGGTQPYNFIPIATHFYGRWDASSQGGFTCNQSRDYCISDGGYLITISSSDENSRATFSSGYAWIGLSDASSEGIWVWGTGEPLSFTNWASGQPNGGTSQNCAEISSTGQWYDYSCTSGKDYYFTCEYEYVSPKIYLNSNGSLSGTATTSGSYAFTAKLTDASGRIVEKQFTLYVDEPLAFTTTRLNDGIVGTAYNKTMAASGGYGAYQWAVFSGTLPDGLSLDTQTGVISGTPTAATYSIIILSVTDEAGRITYKDFAVKISDPLRVLTTALPKGLRDEAYSEAIRTAGGIGPYTFSCSGTLPAGLSLNTSTGAITGTPTTAGITNFGITVSDSTYPTAQTATQDLSLWITSMLTVTTSAILPNIKKDVAISPLTLVAKGGASPYTWSLVSGTLPGGVSLDPQTGQFTGTPTEKGDFVFALKVTDNAGATDQKEIFWHISEVLSIETGAVPDGAKGVPVSIALTASGGLKPYAWALKSGTLPTGLTIKPDTGTIYGTPTTKQTYYFTIEVSDSDSPAQKAEKTYIMDVLDSLYVYTKTVPNGRINDPYTATVEAKLGTPPYTWRLDSGALPAGLQLNSSSTVATIEGTPETTGSYTYTLEASDSGTPVQRNTKEFTFQVYSDVVIDSTGIKTATRGVPYTDGIVVTGGLLPYSYSITAGSLPSGLSLNAATGDITGTTDATVGQSLAFTVRVTDSGNPSDFAERQFAIYVIDPLEITTATIQSAMQKSFYHAALNGNGGFSPYTWSVSAGNLPMGLAITADTALLSGTPAVCGAFDFTVLLTDSAPIPNTFPKAFGLNVLCSNDYDLAGSIPNAAGANIALSGDRTSAATTDSNGAFKFQHLTNGNYTVTPSKHQYWFEPESKTVTVNNLDMAGVDFTAHADSTPPVVGITMGGGGTSQAKNAQFTQTATATDASPSMTYNWSQQSGPGTVTFGTVAGLSTTITASIEGSYTIRFTATDAAGNSSHSDMALVWDTTPPVAVMGTPSVAVTKSGPVTYTVTYTGADAVTLAGTDVTLVKTGTADGTVAVSGTANATRTVTISDITGDGTLGISIATGTASDLAVNLAIASGPSATFIVDNMPPVANAGGSQTKNGIFTQTATGTDANGMTYAWSQQSGPGTVTFGTATGLSTTILASIEGTYTIRFTATDTAGNSSYSDMALVWDTTPPEVVIGAPSAAVTKAGPVAYAVTYTGADAVTLAGTDVTLIKTGTANGTIAVSGTGNTARTVTISDITGDGTLGISIAAGTASDLAENQAIAAGPSATFLVDNTPPVANAGGNQAKNGPFTQTATGMDMNVMTYAWSQQSGPGTVTFETAMGLSTIITASMEGSYTIRFTATDAAGNSSYSDMTLVWDTTPPQVVIGAPSAAVTKSGPVTYAVTYTGADAISLESAQVTLIKTGTTNGTISVSGTGNTSRLVTISDVTGDGTLGISITAGTASDLAGNQAIALGPSATFIVDNTPPEVLIGAPSAAVTKSGPVTYAVTYAGADAVTLAGTTVTLIKTGTANGTIAVSGTGNASRLVTISDITGDGTLGISIAAGTASDVAGNQAIEAGPSSTFLVDNTPPELTLNPVTTPTGLNQQTIAGTVADATAAVTVTTDTAASDGEATISGNTWNFVVSGLVEGTNVITVTARDAAGNIATAIESITYANIKGDVNGDWVVDLQDAIAALKVFSGMSAGALRADFATSGADVDGDGRVGLADVLYILQRIAGMRENAGGTGGAF